VTLPVFLVPPERLAGDTVCLDGPEGRHASVRRLRPGEQVLVTDGAGGVARCTVAATAGARVDLSVVKRRREPPPRPRVVVAQALAKGGRGELAVELMTEVGVDEVIPWRAARCVVEWRGERGDRALAGWRSTAREATKQARRAWLPTIAEPCTTGQLAQRVHGSRLGVVLSETARTPLGTLPQVPADGEIVVVVGPEGGLTDDELAALGPAYRLGPTVLRTSTAGAVAAALVLSRTARWR
jgi:16S rRNA (uracil1498-N3)-methyltransferase